MLKLGIRNKKTFRVGREHTASFLGSGDVSVLSTPSMIAFMEETCRRSVEDKLESGETTVGTRVEINHLKAAPLGAEIEVISELIEVSGRRLRFRVEAYWNGKKIGEGFHERFIVDRERFLSRIEGMIR